MFMKLIVYSCNINGAVGCIMIIGRTIKGNHVQEIAELLVSDYNWAEHQRALFNQICVYSLCCIVLFRVVYKVERSFVYFSSHVY